MLINIYKNALNLMRGPFSKLPGGNQRGLNMATALYVVRKHHQTYSQQPT